MPTRPDPRGLAIARAAQEEVTPDTVILFGSRAAGDHRENSDVDLLVVTRGSRHQSAAMKAHHAARSYMEANPPMLGLTVIGMTQQDFNLHRKANQHIAGQAANHGVIMNGEKLNYSSDYNPGYPAHWPATRQRAETAHEFHHRFNLLVDERSWDQKMLGFYAQQTLENALKGWLSTFNDPRRFGHEIELLWPALEHLELDQEAHTGQYDPAFHQAADAVTQLIRHTTFQDPQNPQRTGNWLSNYAAICRYGSTSHHMSQDERLALRHLVNQVFDKLIQRIHFRSGTTEENLFPEGQKPWEVEI